MRAILCVELPDGMPIGAARDLAAKLKTHLRLVVGSLVKHGRLKVGDVTVRDPVIAIDDKPLTRRGHR